MRPILFARPILSALLSLAVSLVPAGQAKAQIVNPSFENGSFAQPGDANYAVFPGATGTLIYPGLPILTGWNVALSPYDPDHVISAFPAGLEWVNANGGSIDGSRWVDLNRGGDLWQISQTFATVPGQSYGFSYYAVGGNAFGGAVTQVQLVGSSNLIVADDVTTTVGGFHWELFSHPFTANSASTTISFAGKVAGLDPQSGSFIDALRLTPTSSPVPEPGSITLLVGMSLSGAGFLVRRRKNARQFA